MIELQHGQITDLLQNLAVYNPEAKALAFAVLQEKRRIIAEAQQTRTMAVIDELPEKILDVLAVELRTPAYDESFPLETKRKFIKGTLAFFGMFGTPDALDWALRTAFGRGTAQEWYEYGGSHHSFRVVGLTPEAIVDGLDTFLRLLRAIKRQSVILDAIMLEMHAEQQLYQGIAQIITRRITVDCAIPGELELHYFVDESLNKLSDEAGALFVDGEE